MQCFLCMENSATWPEPNRTTIDVTCRACGRFMITFQAKDCLLNHEPLAFDLASWVYQQNRLGITPTIDTQAVAQMRNFPRPDTKRRVELYLEKAVEMTKGMLSGVIPVTDRSLRVASWSLLQADAIALADHLVELGALKIIPDPQRYVLTTKAHMIYDEMVGKHAIATQAFVAMWFQESMKDAYNSGFTKAITDSGYEPFRIDRKEYEGKIDDEIIAEVRRSAFLVADFTGHRGGVYYEAGFAHGLGKRVIFTCKSNDLNKLHFDVRQYNTIVWNTPSEIVAPLQNRILALFGAGPLNPDAKPIPPTV